MTLFQSLLENSEEVESIYSQWEQHRFIKASSLSRVEQHLYSKGFVLISASLSDLDKGDGNEIRHKSAEKGGLLQRISKENFDRYKSLQADLTAAGVGYITLVGRYWEENKRDETGSRPDEELSVLIPRDNLASPTAIKFADEMFFVDFAMKLAVKYEQESFLLTKPDMKDSDGRVHGSFIYTGLRGSRKQWDEQDIGWYRRTTSLKTFLSMLRRANKVDRGESGVGFRFHDKEEDAIEAEVNQSEVLFRVPQKGWSGQVFSQQLEYLYELHEKDPDLMKQRQEYQDAKSHR
jgi:hypothetical protein